MFYEFDVIYSFLNFIQDKGILLTTYDIVRANSKSLRGDNYIYDDESEDNITWDYMILDEVSVLLPDIV